MFRRGLFSLALIAALVVPAQTRAQGLGVSFTNVAPLVGGVTDNPSDDFVLGWSFTALANTFVTGLGVFDDLMDGLLVSHTVGLWEADGTLLASATVGAGTGAPLMGFWRTVSLATAVALTSGTQYVVGASLYNGSELFGFAGVGNVSFDSRISFDDGLFTFGGFQIPSTVQTSCNPRGGFFWCFGGGNVVLNDVVSVPEPGSMMLIATGLLGLLLVGVRRRRQDLASEV